MSLTAAHDDSVHPSPPPPQQQPLSFFNDVQSAVAQLEHRLTPHPSPPPPAPAPLELSIADKIRHFEHTPVDHPDALQPSSPLLTSCIPPSSRVALPVPSVTHRVQPRATVPSHHNSRRHISRPATTHASHEDLHPQPANPVALLVGRFEKSASALPTPDSTLPSLPAERNAAAAPTADLLDLPVAVADDGREREGNGAEHRAAQCDDGVNKAKISPGRPPDSFVHSLASLLATSDGSTDPKSETNGFSSEEQSDSNGGSPCPLDDSTPVKESKVGGWDSHALPVCDEPAGMECGEGVTANEQNEPANASVCLSEQFTEGSSCCKKMESDTVEMDAVLNDGDSTQGEQMLAVSELKHNSSADVEGSIADSEIIEASITSSTQVMKEPTLAALESGDVSGGVSLEDFQECPSATVVKEAQMIVEATQVAEQQTTEISEAPLPTTADIIEAPTESIVEATEASHDATVGEETKATAVIGNNDSATEEVVETCTESEIDLAAAGNDDKTSQVVEAARESANKVIQASSDVIEPQVVDTPTVEVPQTPNDTVVEDAVETLTESAIEVVEPSSNATMAEATEAQGDDSTTEVSHPSNGAISTIVTETLNDGTVEVADAPDENTSKVEEDPIIANATQAVSAPSETEIKVEEDPIVANVTEASEAPVESAIKVEDAPTDSTIEVAQSLVHEISTELVDQQSAASAIEAASTTEEPTPITEEESSSPEKESVAEPAVVAQTPVRALRVDTSGSTVYTGVKSSVTLPLFSPIVTEEKTEWMGAEDTDLTMHTATMTRPQTAVPEAVTPLPERVPPRGNGSDQSSSRLSLPLAARRSREQPPVSTVARRIERSVRPASAVGRKLDHSQTRGPSVLHRLERGTKPATFTPASPVTPPTKSTLATGRSRSMGQPSAPRTRFSLPREKMDPHLPRVAGLQGGNPSEKARGARTPRRATFSLPRAKSTLSAPSPVRRLPMTPVTPAQSRSERRSSDGSSVRSCSPSPVSKSSSKKEPLRKTLSFSASSRSTGSSGSSASSSTVVTNSSKLPWNSSSKPLAPSSSKVHRGERKEGSRLPAPKRLDRSGTLSVGHENRQRPPRNPARNSVTVPRPFSLGGLGLHEKAQQEIEQRRRQADEQETRRPAFKARPMPDFSKPYPPPHQ